MKQTKAIFKKAVEDSTENQITTVTTTGYDVTNWPINIDAK